MSLCVFLDFFIECISSLKPSARIIDYPQGDGQVQPLHKFLCRLLKELKNLLKQRLSSFVSTSFYKYYAKMKIKPNQISLIYGRNIFDINYPIFSLLIHFSFIINLSLICHFKYLIQMSTDKTNILNYLPPQQRQRVLLLIQRLQEETQAKNKYMSLYNQTKNQLNQLQLRYNKLKDQNAYLKQQMHNSFSMISQVRANFQAKKQKLKKNKQKDEEWEEQSQQSVEEQENKLNSSNTHLLNIHPPKPNHKSSSIQKYKPQNVSAEKHSQIFNLSSSFLNNTNLSSASKSKQLDELRRQVKILQKQKLKEQEKAKQLTEKHKLVDQIKNRYRGQDNSNYKSNQKPIERIDITDTFENQYVESSSKKSKPIIPKKDPPASSNRTEISKISNYKIQPKQQKQKKQQHDEGDYGDVLDLINDYNL